MTKILFFILGTLVFQSSHANMLGNMQTFSPTPDSLFFENVHSSKTLGKNHFNLGAYVSFVRNQLSVYDNMNTQNFNNYKDQAWALDFVAAWGVTNHLELFYSAPMFLDQEPDAGQFQNNYISKGINSHRPGVKYDFSQNPEGGLALVASVDVPVSAQDPYTGVDAKPIYNFELAYDIRNKISAYAMNLGYRVREPGALPTNAYFYPLNDQFIYSLGYVTALNTRHRYHVELFGALAQDKSPHNKAKHTSALEALVAYKQRVSKGLWAHIGGTAELLSQGLAPQYRAYVGLNYFFGLEGANKEDKEIEPTKAPQEPVEVASRPEFGSTEIEMYEGESKAIMADGGKAPLTYRLSKPFGEFSEVDMSYQAPARSGQVELIVEDASGARDTVLLIVKPIPKAQKELVLTNMQFKFNSDELTDASKKLLATNVEKLRGETIKKMIVIGHTDSIGKEEYNLKLSQKRAQAVANEFMNELSLSKDQVQALGYGESRPISTNETETGRQKNRRVELKLYY